MSDREVKTSFPPGAIRHYVGIIPAEVTDAINDLINDINTQIGVLNTAIAGISGVGALGGDLSGTLPNPTIALLAVTNAKMAAGAAAANVGTLGGDLAGSTLPNPQIATGAIIATDIAAGAAATNVGALGGDLTGTLPNPTIAAGAVTNTKMAAGAATANIGTLGGVLAGTLPNPTFAVSTSTVPWFNVMNYGAIGNNVADDTTAINSAIAAANAAGQTSVLYFPGGTYKITATLTTIATNVQGDGPNASYIYTPSNTSAMIVSVPNFTGVSLQGFQIISATTGITPQIGLTIQSNSGYTLHNSVRDVYISNCYIGIDWKNNALGSMVNVQITGIVNTGLLVRTPVNGDVGDTHIVNCQFWGSVSTTGIGISWQSGGGFCVSNCKFLLLQYGYYFGLASGVTTSQNIINGCNFDSLGGGAIAFLRSGTTGTFSNMVINNNIFSECLSGVTINTDANGAWLVNLTVVGNIYLGTPTAGGYFVNLDSCYSVMVSNNSCQSSTAGATTHVYNIGAGVSGGVVGPNVKGGTTWGANTNSGTGITIIAPN